MLDPARQNRCPHMPAHGSSSRTGRHAQQGVLGALRDYDLVFDGVVHHVELVLGPGGGERGEVLEWEEGVLVGLEGSWFWGRKSTMQGFLPVRPVALL